MIRDEFIDKLAAKIEILCDSAELQASINVNFHQAIKRLEATVRDMGYVIKDNQQELIRLEDENIDLREQITNKDWEIHLLTQEQKND